MQYLANLLVVPLVPIAMLFSLFAGLAGMLLPTLSGIFTLPAKVLLTYLLDLVQLMSRIPNALIERQLSLKAMLFQYACVFVFVILMWRATEKKHGTIATEKSGENT